MIQMISEKQADAIEEMTNKIVEYVRVTEKDSVKRAYILTTIAAKFVVASFDTKGNGEGEFTIDEAAERCSAIMTMMFRDCEWIDE